MINLELALRASEVKRWAIVRLTREQSLAEHMYNVYLLSAAMYHALEPLVRALFSRESLMDAALTHDLTEVITGDLPTTLKEAVPEGALREVHEYACQIMGLPIEAPSHTAMQRLLKIADCAEALIFLHLNGGHDRPAVWTSVKENYFEAIARAVANYPVLEWEACHSMVVGAIDDPEWVAAIGDLP